MSYNKSARKRNTTLKKDIMREDIFMFRTIIGVVIAITLVYAGIKQIVTGKMDGNKKDESKYTRESLARASKVTGFLYFPMAILMVIQDLVWDEIIVSPIKPDFIYLIGVGVMIGLVLVVYYALVKKKTGNEPEDEDDEILEDKD